jgi:hypothetical protein
MPRTELKFQSQRIDQLPPDILIKGGWVSTAMALIMTLPPLALFVCLYEVAELHIGVAAGIGFGIHFGVLAFSRDISKLISSFFD